MNFIALYCFVYFSFPPWQIYAAEPALTLFRGSSNSRAVIVVGSKINHRAENET